LFCGQQLTLITDWSVWSDNSLLHSWALVLGQKRRSDAQAADLVALWKREAQLLSVVVDILHALELQADETLVTSSESVGSSSANCALCLVLGLVRCIFELLRAASLAKEIVPCTS